MGGRAEGSTHPTLQGWTVSPQTVSQSKPFVTGKHLSGNAENGRQDPPIFITFPVPVGYPE